MYSIEVIHYNITVGALQLFVYLHVLLLLLLLLW